MHELAVTQSILDIALRHAKSAQAKRVSAIYLVIGRLSSIIDESVQFYWDIIAKDSLAEGARLVFRRIEAEMHCKNCNERYILTIDDFLCPNCGGFDVKILAGDEFYLEAIDIETGDEFKTSPSRKIKQEAV